MIRTRSSSPDPIGWCVGFAALFWVLALVRLAVPSAPFFDEVHYLPAARGVIELGEFINREHPPLGKHIIALGIVLFGDAPFGWRIFSTLAGALALFAGMRAMWFATCSRFATLAFGILLATGFHLFIHARIAMLDVFCVAFLITAYWQFAAAMREPETGRRRLVWCGIALGLAMASKWNAVPLAVIPGLAFLALRLMAGRRRLLLSRRGAPVPGISLLEASLWLGLVPLAVYASTYLHAFHFERGAIDGLISHHRHMLELQTQVLNPHPYQSGWVQWIFNNRAIWYLYEEIDGAQRGVLLIGNPLTMLLGLVTMAWCIWRGVFKGNPAALAVVLLNAVSIGFWIVAAKPIQFYYHYFLPSIFLLAGLALALDALWQSGRKWLALLPLAGSVALFAYFFPILTAAPLEGPMAFLDWAWLESWR